MIKLIGLILAFAGGGIQGAFFFPMKYMRNWRWENGWFLFSVVACFILPVLLALVTTPGLFEIYEIIGLKIIGLVFFFGLCWGVGALLFGLGADYLGMALGIAIITGINVCLGALLPALFLPSGQFSTISGIMLGTGLLFMVSGVVVISIAGWRRDKEQKVLADDKSSKTHRSFKLGLIICIAAGIFVPAANFAVFFGQPITELVQTSGSVAAYNIGHAQMLPFYLGGGIVNILYCFKLFRRHGSFALYRGSGFRRNALLATIMSLLFVFGMVIYVIAVALFIPDLGPVIGWPVFLAATILISNLLGVVSGELKKVHKRTYTWLYFGVFLLLISVFLTSMSSLYS